MQIESMFDDDNHRHIIDEIVHEYEIEYLLLALKDLGLSFSGTATAQNEGANLQNGSLTSSDITNISIANMIENIDAIMQSSILHYIISSKLIATNNGGGIVVDKYYENKDDCYDVITQYENESKRYTYVNDSDIRAAFEILHAMGITNISDLSSIDDDSLEGYFANVKAYLEKNNNENVTMAQFVTESAIINKILSSIFISNASGILQMIGIEKISVNGVSDSSLVEGVEIITISDLQRIINLKY